MRKWQETKLSSFHQWIWFLRYFLLQLQSIHIQHRDSLPLKNYGTLDSFPKISMLIENLGFIQNHYQYGFYGTYNTKIYLPFHILIKTPLDESSNNTRLNPSVITTKFPMGASVMFSVSRCLSLNTNLVNKEFNKFLKFETTEWITKLFHLFIQYSFFPFTWLQKWNEIGSYAISFSQLQLRWNLKSICLHTKYSYPPLGECFNIKTILTHPTHFLPFPKMAKNRCSIGFPLVWWCHIPMESPGKGDYKK